MTEKENKYQRGKIYKIVCNLTGLIYVGSTIEKNLSRRLGKHRADFKRWNVEKASYLSSFQIIVNDDYDIVLLELYPCSSKDELHQRERHFIETLDCVNKNIPSRKTYEYQKQYRQDHKEEAVEYKKEHYLKNKSKIDVKNTQYYEANKQSILDKMKAPFTCVCGSICRSSDRLRHERSKKHQLFIQS